MPVVEGGEVFTMRRVIILRDGGEVSRREA